MKDIPVTAKRTSEIQASDVDLGLCSKRASLVIQEVALANSQSLVDRGLLEEIVADNKARFAGCITMPVTFLFFGLYMAAAMLHEDILNINLVEAPLRQTLVPPLAGLLTGDDVWRYVSDVVVPVFFRQTDSYLQPLQDKNDWSRIFSYSHLKGPLTFEQVRSKMEPCDHELSQHMVCYPQKTYSSKPFGLPLNELVGINMSAVPDPNEGFTVGDNSRRLNEDEEFHRSSSISRRLRVMREELARWMPGPSTDEEYVFRLRIYPTSPVSEIRQRIDYFQQRGWLDDATARLTITALVLNGEIAPPRIESVKLMLAFSRGGGVFATMRAEALYLRAWHSTESVIFDVLFVMMLFVQSGFCIVMTVKAFRKKALRSHFKHLINIMAWVNVTLSWCNILGFFMQNNFRQKLVDQLEVYDMTVNSGTFDEQAAAFELLKQQGDDMTSFAVWYRLLITYMNLFLMLRCFLILEFQPRLAVVVATLKATSIDLLHFLVVFVPTFTAYAIAGMCIFGRRVEEFSSITRSIGTCFKIAMESEYQWEKLSEEDFITSASWVWTFVLLIVLLMLNMVLAIIMDVYTEVRNAAGNSETVFGNIRFLMKRLWLWREWISDDKLLEVLAELPRALTGAEFKKAFPGMTDVQYKRLMNTAVSKAQVSMRTGLHNTFLANMTAAIKVGLDQSSVILQKLRKDQEEFKVKGSDRPDSVCIEDIMQSVAVQNHWMTSVQTQLDGLRALTRTKEIEHNGNDIDDFKVAGNVT